MSGSAKVAISLDGVTLEAVEALRARTGESRSALFSRAVRALIAREDHERSVLEYVRAYERTPEGETEGWSDAARSVLADQEW